MCACVYLSKNVGVQVALGRCVSREGNMGFFCRFLLSLFFFFFSVF